MAEEAAAGFPRGSFLTRMPVISDRGAMDAGRAVD
jgi:hypothetical protein